MAEELKACAECGAPEGYVSGERFMAEHERVRELRADIAALSAQLPSQGGEAVAEYQQLSRYGNWDRIDKVDFDLGILGSCPEKFRALYTHPADQVADDLTMVKVSRELLEDLRDCANECYNHARMRGTSGLEHYENLTEQADALLAKSEGLKP